MNDDRTATALAVAMTTGTDRLDAPADLAERVVDRRRRQFRRRVVGITVGVAAAVTVAALAVSPWGGEPRRLAPVASGSASSPAASPSLSPEKGQHPFFVVTAAPGYVFSHGRTQEHLFTDDSPGWLHRVDYVQAPHMQVTVQTISGEGGETITVENTGSESRSVRIGTRTVVHVRDSSDEGGLNVYMWTEEPGLNVTVIGRGGAADADVRAFIAGLRRRG